MILLASMCDAHSLSLELRTDALHYVFVLAYPNERTLANWSYDMDGLNPDARPYPYKFFLVCVRKDNADAARRLEGKSL